MWPWQKRSSFDRLGLPKTCFISHSYKDSEARQRLLEQLPRRVRPLVFPPITVPPEQMVSDKLLDAITACDGLIYLKGGASEESFWVALERDFALRAKKRVFAFDSQTGKLQQDTTPPMELPVFKTYATEIEDHIRSISGLISRRFFQWEDQVYSALELLTSPFGVGASPDIVIRGYQTTWYKQLSYGGYVVLFWSREAPSSGMAQFFWEATLRDYPDRLLVGLLDTTPLVSDLAALGARGQVVQLYGDAERSEAQRLDDLIVRLYWLIYRNTRQNQLS